MSDSTNSRWTTEQSFLIATYFHDAGKRVQVAAGEALLHQDEPNDRLYLVLSGRLGAYVRDSNGKESQLFQSTRHMFIGVYSFFSQCYRSLVTIVAEEDSELAYIDTAQLQVARDQGVALFEQFMPVVVTELMQRHRQTLQLTVEREQAFGKLLQSEKLASLGQMAAGIAHELNNAIAVLQRHSQWLSTELATAVGEVAPAAVDHLLRGIEQGQSRSTREVRQAERDLTRRQHLPPVQARHLAEMGAADVGELGGDEQLAATHRFWKVGTALHDMQVASRQATHVLTSIRTLGEPHSARLAGQDANGTVREALVLLQSPLRQIEVQVEEGQLPLIVANSGELVQIWTNLIRNACESMVQAQVAAPKLHIRTAADGDNMKVSITDNGPGIPEALRARIFQPNVTTKVDGLSFGLGLGLTIVEGLVQDYGGRVDVASIPGETTFTVRLPAGNQAAARAATEG